jgi:hypothetical protein
MSGQRHPDKETLASLRAGLVSGLRGRRLASHVARCARCAATSDELAAVSSFLASVPVPPMPVSFEQRITAALAAEATARAMTASEHAGATTSPARDRPRPAARRRGPALRFRPAMAWVPLVVCLLAGFAYLLSTIGGPASNSSSSEAFSSSTPNAAVPASGAQAANGVRPPAGFVVTASGTNYAQRTLGAQVKREMSVQYSFAGRQAIASGAGGSASHSASDAGSASTVPSGSAAPPGNLTGCVARLTKGVRPTLVDEAAYQGKPVYVIAVPARAWVVGRGCTASHTELITTVALTAAP